MARWCPCGPFPHRVADAVSISARFPPCMAHPCMWGDPAALGIADLARPDFGDPVRIRPGEIPVFWACGVAPGGGDGPRACRSRSRMRQAICLSLMCPDSSYHV